MHLPTAEATEAIGRALAEHATPGQVIALNGDLGTGKSTLARALGRGLGLTERIPSPTFVIVNTYTAGRLPFHHIDLYRLGEADELEQLALDELFDGGVTAIEWAGLFPEILPADHLWLEITEEDEGRTLTARPTGPTSTALWDAVG